MSILAYIYIYFKIGRTTKRFVFFNLFILFLHTCNIHVCFRHVVFVSQHVWHKAFLMEYSMRLELTLVSSINDLWLVKLVYIGVVVPLSWSVFTLFCFCIYIYIYVCVCIYMYNVYIFIYTHTHTHTHTHIYIYI